MVLPNSILRCINIYVSLVGKLEKAHGWLNDNVHSSYTFMYVFIITTLYNILSRLMFS